MRIQMKTKLIALFLLLSLQISAQNIERNNVVWTSPSNNSMGSMPLGNGDIGLNLWAEKEGNICFYISKTDAWEENGRLLKIGKIKINISPNPFTESNPFVQTLNLSNGLIEIKAGSGNKISKFTIWVDANNPVIHVDALVDETAVITAQTEIWRDKERSVTGGEFTDFLSDINYFTKIYGPIITKPDVLLSVPNKVGWYHHNPELQGFYTNLKQQGLDGFNVVNPLKKATFGALMSGSGFEKKDDKTLVSNSGKEINLTIAVLTEQPSTPEKWLANVEKISNKNNKIVVQNNFKLHKEWWAKFWNRSWIDISANATTETQNGTEKQGDVLTRGYTLQRFINACAGRGNYPIKFNGSIFTVENKDKEGFADYRRWGQGYWWQNTRLPVLSMPASGDFDMMQPFFKMYFNQLPLAKYRAKMAFKHDGAYFAECAYPWGAVFTEAWGDKYIDDMPDRIQWRGHHKYEWVSGLELVTLMYEYYLYTQNEKFAREKLIPMAYEVMLFFEQHYKLDERGKLKFEPSQALETWWECTNALPEVAGMNYLVKIIGNMPEKIVSKDLKVLTQRLTKILPSVPAHVVDGKNMLAPADVFKNKHNAENPELYAVYPFKLYGLGKPEIEMGINAYNARDPKGNFGWRQDDLFAALLGLTDEAQKGIIDRASHWDKGQRFPAFWGPNYDWTPDQDHGGVLLRTTQNMLLQCDDKEIRLFPAWPKDWDVNFKLHAPFSTTIECVYKNGKIEKLIVTPSSREKDIIFTK